MMVPKKWKKRTVRPQSSAPPAPPHVYVSPRLGEPTNEKFLAQTDAWLAEAKADYRRQMGEDLPGNGVLFAHDVLVELHGQKDASWTKFDVVAFERFVRTEMAGWSMMLPSMLADLTVFSNFLARTGRFSSEQALAIQKRTLELCSEQLAGRGAGPTN